MGRGHQCRYVAWEGFGCYRDVKVQFNDGYMATFSNVNLCSGSIVTS